VSLSACGNNNNNTGSNSGDGEFHLLDMNGFDNMQAVPIYND
jgi:hypothetical protein